MSVKSRRFMILLIGCVTLFLFSCASSPPQERLPITPVDEERNVYFESDYSIGDYTVYTKNIGMCELSLIITYFSTSEWAYSDTVNGCNKDPYYYVLYNDEYITINEGADLGLFTDEEVINELVNEINE